MGLLLVIQIPCFNEAETLEATLRDLPTGVVGVDRVEWLVVDDGSTDGTARVAQKAGVHHVVSLPVNQGLAAAFQYGIDTALALGADFIVNTDGDNQYRGADVSRLVAPLLAGQADLVVGVRPLADTLKHRPVKRALNRLGSWVMGLLSGAPIPDAPSGFRAMTRACAQRITILDRYTYTLDMLLQAERKGIAVSHVPIRVNPVERPSRLMRSLGHYVVRSALTMLRLSFVYRPLRVLGGAGALSGLVGLGLLARFLYFHFTQPTAGHIQSVVVGALLVGLGVALGIGALFAEAISVNRRLLEEIKFRQSRMEDRLLSQTAPTRKVA